MAAFLKEWWQTCHRENNYYISDFGGPELWQWMGIRPQAGDRVLAIGVGGGEDCRQLAAIGAQLEVLDIATFALERIRGIADRVFSDPLELPACSYDLAISHLVAQHMSNDDLRQQIERVVRALKPEGLFALQFADFFVPCEFSETLEQQQQGNVRRTMAMLAEIVDQAGGKIVWTSTPKDYEFVDLKYHNKRWWTVHIKHG